MRADHPASCIHFGLCGRDGDVLVLFLKQIIAEEISAHMKRLLMIIVYTELGLRLQPEKDALRNVAKGLHL